MKNNDDQRDRNATILTESRGGGQSRPRTPSGRRSRWQPPRNTSTASGRQSETTHAGDPVWYTAHTTAERAKFGHWELAIQPTEDGNSWEWTATLPDWEDDNGKQYQGASFKGRSPTKDDAKADAKQKASTTLLG